MRRLVVVYDVSELTDDEIAGLGLEVEVQAEASERHRDVPAVLFVTSDPIEVEAIDRQITKRRFRSWPTNDEVRAEGRDPDTGRPL